MQLNSGKHWLKFTAMDRDSPTIQAKLELHPLISNYSALCGTERREGMSEKKREGEMKKLTKTMRYITESFFLSHTHTHTHSSSLQELGLRLRT